MKNGLFVVIILCSTVFLHASSSSDDIPKDLIINSTWSLCCWQILGYDYEASKWKKGNDENGNIGEIGHIDSEKNVRAVCLGKEGGFFVFFTLRSFVDPTFPNMFIQQIHQPLLNRDGQPFSKSEIENGLYVRYGAIDLFLYEDVGGGTYKIKNKLQFATHSESGNPKCYNRKYPWGSKKIEYEEVDSVKYERSHKDISAKDHLSLQSREKITVKIISEHDVALLYIPASMLDGQNITTLGMENPTLAVRLALEKTRIYLDSNSF